MRTLSLTPLVHIVCYALLVLWSAGCSSRSEPGRSAFQTGFSLEESGSSQQAITQYRQLLATTPNHLTARKRLGRLLLDRKQYPEAEKHLAIAHKLAPGDASILSDLGHAAFSRNDSVQAILFYRRAIALAPDEAKYYYNLGVAYQSVGRHSQALQNFQRAIDLDSTFADAYLAAGLSYAETGKQKQAIVIWQKADRLGLASAHIAYYLGLASLDADKLPLAKTYFDKALRYAPQAPEPHNGLAALALRRGNLERAMFHWKAAADRADSARFVNRNFSFNGAYEARRFSLENSLDVIVGVASKRNRPEVVEGVQKLSAQDWSGAEAAFKRALAIEPQNERAKSFLAYVLALQNKYHEAHSIWEELAKQKRDDVRVINNLGVMKVSLGYTAPAIKLFEKVIEIEPSFWRGYHNLAATYAKTGDVSKAISFYKKALAVDERVPEVHNDLGYVYESSGAMDDALTSYARAVEIDPDFEMANFNLGLFYLRINDLSKAGSYFRKVLRSNPDDVQSLVNLGYILGKQGRLREASVLWEKASHLDPTSGIARNNIGVALYMQGKFEEAADVFLKAEAGDAPRAEVLNNKAASLVKSGKKEEAITAYLKALELNPKDTEARRNVGKLLLEQGKLEEASHHFQLLVSREHVDATALFLLGVTYQKLGRSGAAITVYEAFLDLVGAEPRYSEYSFQAQRAIEQLGRTPQFN